MIKIKTCEEIEKIKTSCQIVAEVLEELSSMVRPGVRTKELDKAAEESVRAKGATPAFKGYQGFPATLCTSVNEEVVHGIPSDRVLKEGDIVSIDCGVLHDGFYGDSAITVAVGEIAPETRDLMEVTKKSLEYGIEQAKAGNRVSDISRAVQQHAEKNNYSIVRSFVGHGIGKELHEDPQIPNYVIPGESPKLEPGMVLAIEPMVSAGTHEVLVAKDGWTAYTKDRRLSAHYEHTVAILKDETLVLTQREVK